VSDSNMDDDDLKAPADFRLLLRALPILAPEAPLYLLALLAAPVSTVLQLVLPWLLKVAIDDHIVKKDVPGVLRVAGAYLAATLTAFVFEAIYTMALSYGATWTIARLRLQIFDKTLSFSAAFWDKRPTGRLLTRATSDVEALGETLTAGAFTIVLDALLVLGTAIAMFWLNWRLTLVAALIAPVVFAVVELCRRQLRTLFLVIRASLSTLTAYTAERLTGLEVLQLYSAEERALARHDRLLARYADANIRSNIWDALLFAIVDGLAAVTMALILWWGSGHSLADGAAGGAVTAGLVAAYLDYVGRLFRPIQEFSQKLAVLQRAGASLEKIFGLLDHREHIEPGDLALPSPKGEIELRGVGFAYASGQTILRDVTFRLGAGEVVALVGRTGSGKSTIARLITRTYDGYSGSITLDGHELRRIHPRDVRRAIGLVRQDVQLFPGTVRFNLTLGHPISDARLVDAISAAQADEVVARLGGLDGAVSHQGANLSVGEAQLLAFARVLAHDAPVIVLDEATASVDTLTEAKIQAATKAVFERKTSLVIAHRLSTIVNADRIVLLDAGGVLEVGSHDELMAQDGSYAALFRQQFIASPSDAPEADHHAGIDAAG
jgi:ATP-binding cassette subfamily B multidrug efflux pump